MREIKFEFMLIRDSKVIRKEVFKLTEAKPGYALIDGMSEVFRQFTGLCDKNGKDIYDGDIVVNGLSGTWIVQPLEGGSFSLLGVCEKYKDSNFLISALNDHVEIIGNIYENPELLTQ